MMKRILLPLVLLVVSSCASNSGNTANTTPADPRAFADKFIAAEEKAWQTGDVADLKALEDTDVVYHLAGTDIKSWKAHEDYIVSGRKTISDLKQNWKYLSGEGNHFAMDYASSAILLGDAKTPPSAVSNTYLFMFRLKDNKVAEVWVNGSVTSKEIKPEKKKK
jgi:ketosteroid isomerase-like protein